jgi:hypothetical protein
MEKISRIKHTMRVRTPHFLSALLLAAASTTVAVSANAQEYGVVFRPRESVPEAVNRTYYRHSESMVQENDSLRAIQGLLGTFQFPENAILKDSKDVHGLYNFLMERQTSDDPTIRTADLNTPFNLSVQTLPTTRANRLNGGEFVFERTPETAAPAATPVQPMAPEPTQPAEPVQAKF